jgi:ABC-2 type transport system permease protein
MSATTAPPASPPATGPRQIKGPSALGSDPKQFLRLTWTLAVTDFRLRFFGSALGYLWTLMRPMMTFGVLIVLFTVVLDLTDGVALYPQALLLGLVLYQLFSDATTLSVRSIVERENIVRKIEFPRLAVPAAVVVQMFFNFVLNLVVVVAFLLAAGGEVRWSWLQMIPLVALLAAFTMGLCMLLSMLFVKFRDVQPIWEVIAFALFYLSPIFYTVDYVTRAYDASVVKWIIMLNPFAAILQQARHAMIDPSHPSAADAAGGAVNLLVPAAIALVIVLIGAQVFRRGAPRVAEEV